jgi:hypothetical protein
MSLAGGRKEVQIVFVSIRGANNCLRKQQYFWNIMPSHAVHYNKLQLSTCCTFSFAEYGNSRWYVPWIAIIIAYYNSI